MAQEIREFAVTVPANTPKATPVVTSVGFPSRLVRRVSWRVPPGPSGLMGWALTSAGTPVIPIQAGTFLVTDNQSDTWDLDGYLDSGNWAVTAYNLGVYPHTVYLTFLLDLPGTAPAPAPADTGAGVGVIGITGTVPVPPPVPPPPVPPLPPSSDGTAAVVPVVLAVLLSGIQGMAG